MLLASFCKFSAANKTGYNLRLLLYHTRQSEVIHQITDFINGKVSTADWGRDLTDEQVASKFVQLVSQSMTTKSAVDRLAGILTPTALTDVLAQFSQSDYWNLTPPQRMFILRLLMVEGNVSSNGQGIALKVLDGTPSKDASKILDSLAMPSTLNAEKYRDKSNDRPKAMIVRLSDHAFDKILIGDNNYTGLMQSIIPLMAPDLDRQVESLVLHLNKGKNLVSWVDNNELDNKETGLVQIADIVLKPDGSVDLSTKEFLGWEDIPSPDSHVPASIHDNFTTPVTTTYKPFDLVLLSTQSKLSVVKNIIGPSDDQMAVVPAIFLDYIHRKNTTKDIQAGVVLGLNVALMITGAGEVAAAARLAGAAAELRAGWGVFTLATAAGNITRDQMGAGLDSTVFSGVLDAANGILLIEGGASLFNSGVKTATEGIAASNGTLTAGITVEKASKFQTAYAKIATKIDALAASGNKTANVLQKLHDLLGTVLGQGKTFSISDLMVLKRPDLPNYVKDNLENLLSKPNREIIWQLTDENRQFTRGDIIEEIFNQWSAKYKNYKNLNEFMPNYKTVDFDGFLTGNNEVISLKTFNPVSTTPKTLDLITKKIKYYAKGLASATLDASLSNRTRVLDFTIKAGEWESLMPQLIVVIRDIQRDYDISIKITKF